eukprot:11550577-Ditylum_brightwellii.AAC.1
MSITQGDIVGRIIESSSDEYGQWVYTKFTTSDECVVTVITAYQPCKVSKKHSMTTYHQQVAQLQQEGRKICPRKASFRTY